jgi:mannose-6-phosphate isomerase-like protein (cupin superfamily)
LIAADGKSLDAVRQRSSLQSLARSCGSMETPHAYWQFYLSSSIALTNYFHCVARDHSKFFRYLGALYHHRVIFNAHCRQYMEMLQSTFGPGSDTRYFAEIRPGTLFPDLLEPTLDAYGERVIDEIARGFEEYRILSEIAEEDFIAQIRWSSRTEEYKEKARLIAQRIESEKMNIDLETYVESCEERSTTHVHDTDRLLVIESGEMDFWSCFGPAIRFNAGDQMLIPKSRLHGSVVLSDECTYHQPIIPPELLREFE